MTASGTLLGTLSPKARDDLRPVLIRDRADRDAISSELLRYRDKQGLLAASRIAAHRLPAAPPPPS